MAKLYITDTAYFEWDGTYLKPSKPFYLVYPNLYFDSIFSIQDPNVAQALLAYTSLTGVTFNVETNETHKFSVDNSLSLTISETEITAAVPFKPAQMDTSTRLGLTPADGMIVRDTDLNQIFVYIGGWYSLDMTAEA